MCTSGVTEAIAKILPILLLKEPYVHKILTFIHYGPFKLIRGITRQGHYQQMCPVRGLRGGTCRREPAPELWCTTYKHDLSLPTPQHILRGDLNFSSCHHLKVKVVIVSSRYSCTYILLFEETLTSRFVKA